MSDSEPYRIFISHGSSDTWVAKQMDRLIQERTTAFNVSTFLDVKDIEGGASFHDTILPAIQDADELVVLMTPESKEKSWVTFEVGSAYGCGIHVTAITYRLPPEDLPEPMQGRKALPLDDFDVYLDELVERIEQGT